MADRKRHEELIVITKTYDLILWSCNHTGKFPRNHRFVLGERIERNLYDLLEILIRAKYTTPAARIAGRSQLELEILRFQMRLAKDLQCLKVESYGFAAKAIDEIGKLVGGWLKSERQSMKRHGNLWEQVITFEALLRCRRQGPQRQTLPPRRGRVSTSTRNGRCGSCTKNWPPRPTDREPTAASSSTNPRSGRSVRPRTGIGSSTTP